MDRVPKVTVPAKPHLIGIDASELLVARTGFRGSNDLVWIGPAANHAAKLTEVTEPKRSTWITAAVYNRLDEGTRIGSDGRNMWTQYQWTEFDGSLVYATTYWMEVG
jgi:class 3 adenylate cyclase